MAPFTSYKVRVYRLPIQKITRNIHLLSRGSSPHSVLGCFRLTTIQSETRLWLRSKTATFKTAPIPDEETNWFCEVIFHQPIILPKFPGNCMKTKKSERRDEGGGGGTHPNFYYVDLPLHWCVAVLLAQLTDLQRGGNRLKLLSRTLTDPGFPRGGSVNHPGWAPTYNFAKCSQRKNLDRGVVVRPVFYYVDLPLMKIF